MEFIVKIGSSLNPGLGEQRMYLFVTSNMSLIIRLGHL